MIIWFTPYQTTTLQKWMFFQKLYFRSSLLLNGQCGIQVGPPNSSDDLYLLFFHIHLLWSAGERGIYSLLDMHQDVFNRKFCGNGVPDWAAVHDKDNFPYPLEVRAF